MKLELSPAMQLAFNRARHVALRDRAAEVIARHMLIGILAEEEGKAAALLMDAGADWKCVQAHLGLPVVIDAALPPDLPLHPAMERVMAAARELAMHHGEEGSVSTAHVLLALLTVDETMRTPLTG